MVSSEPQSHKQLAAERHHLREQLAIEHERLRQELGELKHDLKSHSMQTAVAGAIVAGAATLFGIGPAALAAVGAFVAFRILSHRARVRSAHVERHGGSALLMGSCPVCGVAVAARIPPTGDCYVEVHCRNGHLSHTVVMAQARSAP